MSDLSAGSWLIIGSSVQGASHKRGGLPNQDAIFAHPRIDVAPAMALAAPPIILAVSDGHGSPRSFRSGTGANTAVQVAVERTREFIDHFQSENLRPDVIRDITQNRLPAEIVRSWKKEVLEHFGKNPFDEEEMRKAEAAVGGQAHELMEDQGLYLAYGTTLIVVAITESYILYLQIGDGDILVVGDDGKSMEVPIPPDASMVGNETASLCLPSAQNLFRSCFQNVGERLPDLIAVSTDGYSNSFADTPSFQKIGPDFLRLIRSHGIEHVRGEMGAWLDQVSERGSGDDITLGLLVHRGAPATQAELPTIGFEAQAQEGHEP
jgi:protein phosphatase 2C-like protein